jgi:hypothetical protein
LSAKVVLSGKLSRKVVLKGVGATKGAKAAIEAAGGSWRRVVAGTRKGMWRIPNATLGRAASSAISSAGCGSCWAR